MSPNLKTSLIDNFLEQNDGVVWRLHSEREDIRETMLRESSFEKEISESHSMSSQDAVRAANWHRELLQARLQNVDDALDRLMSGSYGNCSNCGKWIEDTKLDFDPAIAFCLGCWERMQTQH